jgi:hypothetical protein
MFFHAVASFVLLYSSLPYGWKWCELVGGLLAVLLARDLWRQQFA